jgi:4-amino-4-deoxychorismate lyase
MYPLLETIRLENRAFHNLELHERRMRRSRRILFGIDDPIHLNAHLAAPEDIDASRYKCRLEYGSVLGEAEYLPYKINPVGSLRVVSVDTIEYSFKYSNRTRLDEIRKMRGSCDGVIIVVDGRLTDTTYSNIALFNGDRWITPDAPLLAGTKRDELLSSGVIDAEAIRIYDLDRFEKIALINAMLDLGEVEVPVEKVVR